MSATERVFLGTELKFLVEITAQGFSMVDDDFIVAIARGPNVRVFTKGELIQDENDKFYCCFDTAEFGSGLYKAVITAYVPDDDFEDGFRTEVFQLDLIRIDNVVVRRTPYGLMGGV